MKILNNNSQIAEILGHENGAPLAEGARGENFLLDTAQKIEQSAKVTWMYP